MSKVYWRTTIVAGLTVLAAFAIAGFILGFGLGEQSGERNANTDSYARHAQDEINSTCARLDGLAQTECVVRVVEATNEHERAENDLIAQQNMGRWALLMLIATAAMAIITAVGVYYVWRTLVATKKMADDTRDIGEKQVRAYVSLAVGRLQLKSGMPPGISPLQVHIRNSGNSPAKQFSYRVRCMLPSGKETKGMKVVGRDLASGEQHTTQVICHIGTDEIEENSLGKEGGASGLLLAPLS